MIFIINLINMIKITITYYANIKIITYFKKNKFDNNSNDNNNQE